MAIISYTRLWGLVGAYLVATILLYGATGLSVSTAGAGMKLTCMTFAAIALLTPWLREHRLARWADLFACWGLMTILSTLGALMSYPVVLGTLGWNDALLASMDHAIGFDWISAYQFVAARPGVNALMALSYMSIFLSPVVVIAGLTLSGKSNAARAFLFAFGIALAVTLIVYRFLPARSALAYHLGTEIAFMPTTGIGHIAVIEQLRAGTLTTIQLNELLGMITFPSFHAVAAVLFIWAGWQVRWLRVPVTVINIGMLLATPIQGTHYLVDVIAGVALALASIGVLHLPRIAIVPSRLRMPRPALAPA